ncbi:MAG: DNA-3-methyladenine glycosylase I [Sterolibacterium sp.]|nr:DNA-3-methyladenine glycosylase I [Sterolibacterium sp.]
MNNPALRCSWCGNDPLYVAYHDSEWGVPLHDERALFEFLTLEGAQAGLSWISILRKRDNYRAAFDGFDPLKIACYDQHQVMRLLNDQGIVRNRLKIAAAINNAGKFLALQDKFGGFDAYLWRFVDGRQVHNAWQSPDQLPAQTPLSRLLSKDLTRQGFKFVGPTICYSLMQAVGLVNDHLIDCFRYRELNPAIRISQ